jgi:hypothetical protein
LFLGKIISIFKSVELFFASKSFPFLESYLYIATIVSVKNNIGHPMELITGRGVSNLCAKKHGKARAASHIHSQFWSFASVNFAKR